MKRGLPDGVKGVVSTHYVETFQPRSEPGVGRFIPIDLLVPNPAQPRSDFADIDSLAGSIRENGVIEPLIVRPVRGGTYEIVAGERRYRAGLLLGLRELPCIERAVSEAEALELSLVENLQRQDLSPFEEAQGLRALSEKFDLTHGQIARRLGKSRTAVTETLGLNKLPEDIQARCAEAGVRAKNLLYRVLRTRGREARLALIDAMARGAFKTQAASPAGRRGRPRNYVFHYAPRGRPFELSLKFNRTQVEPDDVLEALRSVLNSVEESLRQAEAARAGPPNGAEVSRRAPVLSPRKPRTARGAGPRAAGKPRAESAPPEGHRPQKASPQ